MQSQDPRAVANLILDIVEEATPPATNLKLQKLLFFSHAWTLVRLDTPLLSKQFEAWEFGPVMPCVYKEFANFKGETISTRASILDRASGQRVVATANLPDHVVELVRSVVAFYGTLSASDLVAITHRSGSPWHRVWNHKTELRVGMEIGDKAIREFYSTLRSASGVH